MKFAREAWPFVAPFPLLALALAATGRKKSALGALAAGGAVLAFFRDPERAYFGDADTAVAAADGMVTVVDDLEDPAVGPGRFHRVVTFLSAFDVHVQKTPTDGVVVASALTRGKKLAAFKPDVDKVNEAHLTVIERPDGERLGVRQIAGLIARRVVCHLSPGQPVHRGQPMGLIKFGSRVDLLVPESWEVLARVGDRLRNGETPVARRR
ncbi:MAG TPA: phosphatidylserine decarboxylase [Thermoanaerobaculia bacterium]|jgi:phosphatidylserine decarboxylase|nr:phosphatidylserine decarboxylase [Thermoanaerobaculia bacterium]